MFHPERSLKKYLIRIMGQRWDVQSHEDQHSEGIPDLSFATNIHGWIELKHINDWPKNNIIVYKKYTAQQVNWLRARGRRAGNCWVLTQINKDYFLHSWIYARELKNKPSVKDFCNNAVYGWKGSIDPDELAIILSLN